MCLQAPHRIYKRYQDIIEGAVTAVGVGLLVAAVLISLPVYPANWAPVLVVLVVLVGFRWPLLAYLLAGVVIVYPVYTVSLYLAILFIALVVILQRPLSHYLGATILILAVPWLAKYNLHWIVPLLAGLWWGAANGFWIAGAAAVWGKLLGGMAGLNADWLTMAGQSPAVAGVLQRYHGLGALETLLKLIQPYTVNSTVLLYHLLQITLWATVGVLMGIFGERTWIYRKHPWVTVGVAAVGAVFLVAGHVMLATWLVAAAPGVLPYNSLVITAGLGIGIAGSLDVARRYLDLPSPPQSKKWLWRSQRRRVKADPPGNQRDPQRQQPVSVPLPELPEWKASKDENDLILLELD